MTLTTPLCACGQPSPQAVLCGTCTQRLKSALQFAAAIAPDLDDAVARLLTRGSGGPRVRSHEVPLPIDLTASDAAGNLRITLFGWARVLLETAPSGDWPADTIAGMARWLAARMDVIRQHEAAQDIHDEITAAVAKVLRVVDRQPDRVPAGFCEACGSALLAELGADEVRCSCGMLTMALRQKRTERAAAADVLGSAGEISGALARIGIQVPRGTITSWASRGRLLARPGGVYAMSEVLALASARTAR